MNRSTYGAELNGLSDAIEPGKLLALMYAETLDGVRDGSEWKLTGETGKWPIPIEFAIDAKSVFDSVVNPDLRIPTEQSLITVLIFVREQFHRGLIKRAWWVQTMDMVADALTKGSVSRKKVLEMFKNCFWKVEKEVKRAQLTLKTPNAPAAGA